MWLWHSPRRWNLRCTWSAGGVRDTPGITQMNGESNPQVYDVIIIGGGHNGLVAAGYLGKAG